MARDLSNHSKPQLSASDVHFKCGNLESAIRQHLNISKGAISHKDLASITSFDASRNYIVDISGLEYATGLSSLELNENLLADIRPLAELTNLTELYLNTNKLTDITPLVSLRHLLRLVIDCSLLNQVDSLERALPSCSIETRTTRE